MNIEYKYDILISSKTNLRIIFYQDQTCLQNNDIEIMYVEHLSKS